MVENMNAIKEKVGDAGMMMTSVWTAATKGGYKSDDIVKINAFLDKN